MPIVLGILGSLLLFCALLVLWIISARAEKKRKWVEKTSLYCGECGAQNEGAAHFCGQCGSKDLMGLEDFHRWEDRRGVFERAREINETAKRDDAIRRIAELRGLAWCLKCETGYEAGIVFCTKCGTDIGDSIWPDEKVFEVVQREFPDVVGSFRCYETLRESAPSGRATTALQRGLGEALDGIKRAIRRG